MLGIELRRTFSCFSFDYKWLFFNFCISFISQCSIGIASSTLGMKICRITGSIKSIIQLSIKRRKGITK